MPRVDHEKLLEHIREKAGRVKCPICRRGPMSFSDSIYGVFEGWPRSNMDQKIMNPLVALSCDNCGGISFIGLAGSGIEILDGDPTGKAIKLK